MADHLREQILDAVTSNITGLVTTGDNVTRARIYNDVQANLPSLNVIQGDDEPLDNYDEERVYNYVDRLLTITIEARVQMVSVQVDQVLNRIAKEVTIALQSDRTQGVTGVIDTTEGPTETVDLTDEAEQPTAMLTMVWRFYYRTSRTDPSI